MLAIVRADAGRDRIERAVEHEAGYVSIGQAQALMRADRVAAIGRMAPLNQ